MIGQWLSLGLAVFMTGNFYSQLGTGGAVISEEPDPGRGALTGSYSIVIEDYDWGAGVSRAIVSLEQDLTQVSPEQFRVDEEKEDRENSSADLFAVSGGITVVRNSRTVTDAWLSDGAGNPAEGPSKYVTLELDAGPNIGSPFCLQPDTSHYRWADPYQLVIDLAPGQTLVAGKTEYDRLAVARTPTGRVIPQLDGFQFGSYDYRGQTLGYAEYALTVVDGDRHPLVVWLHGLGEGGDDPRITLLGSRAANLAGEEIQGQLGGAYILVPQCPTKWMDGQQDGESRYTDALMALIRSYASAHQWVDPYRVYVGGCSNGGYMTLALLLKDPDYFAAAFPICEAYRDEWLDEAQIDALGRTPVWFVHSALDQVCSPEESTLPTIRRLQTRRGAEIRLAWLAEILDEELDYRYNPHYAWVPVLRGECVESDELLFRWLARQNRR